MVIYCILAVVVFVQLILITCLIGWLGETGEVSDSRKRTVDSLTERVFELQQDNDRLRKEASKNGSLHLAAQEKADKYAAAINEIYDAVDKAASESGAVIPF